MIRTLIGDLANLIKIVYVGKAIVWHEPEALGDGRAICVRCERIWPCERFGELSVMFDRITERTRSRRTT